MSKKNYTKVSNTILNDNKMRQERKMVNRLKKDWRKTNYKNWDVMETTLKSASKMINSGTVDKELVYTYITISEAFSLEFGKYVQ